MTTFDPTTNRVAYGLLTDDEKLAILSWPHGLEHYDTREGLWRNGFCCLPDLTVYRGKPAPVVTSTWRNVYGDNSIGSVRTNSSRLEADRVSNSNRIAVLRIDTCNGVSTAHLEEV